MFFVKTNLLSGEIIQIEEKTTAEIVLEFSQLANASDQFSGVTSILRAVSLLRADKKYILLYPGMKTHTESSRTVSVHESIDEKFCVDIERDLDDAKMVFMNNAALLTCFRVWKWTTEERVEYTFPAKEKNRSEARKRKFVDGSKT